MGTTCCKSVKREEYELPDELPKIGKLYDRGSILTINPSYFILEKSKSLKRDYTFKDKLGQGAYGVVYKVIHNATGQARAIKWISRSQVTEDAEKKFIYEINILKCLDYPGIMKIYGFAADTNGFSIISEFLPGGELFDAITNRKCFTEADAAYVMKQLLAAISYCHSKNIIHRDLKPENVLIDSISDNKLNVKIIDFGTALICKPNTMVTEKVGTIYYIAPEVLKGNYTSKCDVWSLGIIMYILLSGYPPFNGETDQEILEAIDKGTLVFPSQSWDGVSADAKDLICRMLSYDPEKRITAGEAFQHNWFQICCSNKLDLVQGEKVLLSLKNFNAKSKLQKAAMMFIATQLMSKQERDQLRGVFVALDKNGDGKLTRSELVSGYSRIFRSDSLATREVDEMLKVVDMNDNGEIDYSEFLIAAANKKKLLTLQNVKEAFEAFDLNGNGYISHDELKEVLGPGKKIDEKVWTEIIKEVDTNGDGKISYAEFEGMMMKHLS